MASRPSHGPNGAGAAELWLVRKKTLHEGWYGGPPRNILALDVGGQGSDNTEVQGSRLVCCEGE